MSKQSNLLIIGDFNRKDFLDLFEQCKGYFNLYFLEFASEKEIKSTYYKNFGQALFWKDFTDAYALLNKVKPVKVVFFFIESYNHVALNVACKVKGIKTFHLEHGYRDYDFTKFVVAQVNKSQTNKTIQVKSGYKTNLRDSIIKAKTLLFFFTTLVKSPSHIAKFLLYYFKVRRVNIIFETFRIVKSPLRLASAYISFSPAIFNAHKKFDHLTGDQEVSFIGFPMREEFSHIRVDDGPISKNIILIEQPFVKQGLLGWDKEFQRGFISQLVDLLQDGGFNLYVKKHPFDELNLWDSLSNLNKVTLVNDDLVLADLMARPSIVLGFYSTLLIPLAALPNTTVITLEVHPIKEVYPSEFLVKSGVSEPVFSLNELSNVLQSVEDLHEKQKIHKQKFVDDWLYRFDNGAQHRLREILIK